MKTTVIYFSIFMLLLILISIGCNPKRNFFQDDNNPDLSRFTSRGYNIATAYINDTAYVNPYRPFTLFGYSPYLGNDTLTITKIHTNSTFDTLSLFWELAYSDTSIQSFSPYYSLSLLIPVSKSFFAADFIALKGKRFLAGVDSVTIELNNGYGYVNNVSGPASLYFIQIAQGLDATQPTYFVLSGLFNGSIGNNILITKGRFDFEIHPYQINF